MNEEPKQHKFGILAICVLVAGALAADLIGLIPFAKDITATLFWVIVSFYMWMKGMGIFSGRKLAAMLTSWIMSVIPFIQEIPIEVTGGIIAIIILTRIEEKTGHSFIKPLMNGKPVTLPRLKRPTPLNKAGTRAPRKISELTRRSEDSGEDNIMETDFGREEPEDEDDEPGDIDIAA